MNYIHALVAYVVSHFADSEDAEDRGATATEYALLVAFIALAIVVAVAAFGTALSTFFTGLGKQVGISK